MSVHIANPEHQVTYLELNSLLRKHAGHLSPIEVLAIAANMLGRLVAMQDQREITPEIAMQVVSKNLQIGNREMVEQLSKEEGHA